MYNNVGREIKYLAKGYVIGETIQYILFVVLVSIGWRSATGDILVPLLVGIPVVLWGYRKARLKAIEYYAFGELVETNASTAKSAEELVKLMKGDVGNTAKTASTKSAVQTAKCEGQKTGVWNPNAFSHYKDNE